MNIAPIILFVYNRPEHTKKTVDALKLNKFAADSSLFIFSDGNKDEMDRKAVEEVRSFISTISGFNQIKIILREKNLGLANSVISGVTEVISKYEKAIVLEDDIVTSPYFLKFLNEALEFYQDEMRIYSISGYSFPVKLPKKYPLNYFFAYRTSSWGWATWKDRWEKLLVDMNEKFYVKNPTQLNAFLDIAGMDLAPMLLRTLRGQTNSWAVKWAYIHIKNNALCLFPTNSLVKNIGTDASGVNFVSKTKKYDVEIFDSKIYYNFNSQIRICNKIQSRIRKLFRPGILSLIKYRIFKII